MADQLGIVPININFVTKTQTEQEERNKNVVTTLYEAFNNNHNIYQSVHLLLAPYLEWWYHGPHRHQHLLKRLLTGSSPSELSFPLWPLSLVAFGSTVIAEGQNESGSVSWVHAWTLSTDGVITLVREYYNTSVTVTRLGGHVATSGEDSAEIVSQAGGNSKCESVWRSKLCDESSAPGLVLAL